MNINTYNKYLKYEDMIDQYLTRYKDVTVCIIDRIPIIEFYKNIGYPIRELTLSNISYDIKKNKYRHKNHKYLRFKTKAEYDNYLTEFKTKNNSYSLFLSERELTYDHYGFIFAISTTPSGKFYHFITINKYDSTSIGYIPKEILDDEFKLPIYTTDKEYFSLSQYQEIIHNYEY